MASRSCVQIKLCYENVCPIPIFLCHYVVLYSAQGSLCNRVGCPLVR
jgi:hypothetical protein